jgi:hypothetical protein
MNNSNNTDPNESGYSNNGYDNNQQSKPYGVPDRFADGYQENIFEGDLNLADTPWTETASHPNPQFNNGIKNPLGYSNFEANDLEL